jgi:PAS domain S-box-containing protein
MKTKLLAFKDSMNSDSKIADSQKSKSLSESPDSLELEIEQSKEPDLIKVSRQEWQQTQISISLANIGLMHLSFEGHILWANPFYWKFIGYKDKDQYDFNIAQTSRPQDIRMQFDLLSKLKNGELENAEFDKSYLRYDGTYVWGHVSCKLHRDENQKPKFVVVVIQDINSRKESENLLRMILRNVPSLISFMDRDLKYKFANEAYLAWFGLSSNEIIGKTMNEILGENAVAVLKSSITKVLNGEYLEFERRIPYLHGGTRDAHLTYIPNTNPIGEVVGFVAIVQDVSQLKQTSELALDQQSRLIESARLAAIGELAAGLYHEVSKPLAIITAKADQILMRLERAEGSQSQNIQDDLLQIKETSFRISKIVKGLRAFSNSNEKDVNLETNLSFILEDALSFCSEKFKNYGIELIINNNTDIRFKCRPLQITQVILSLLNNSFDAVKDLKEKWIKISAFEESNRLRIRISDSGPELSAAIISKLMTPFFTTKMKGTGLGLNSSRGIIEDHGGKLFYDSSDFNTCFVIEFPRKQSLLKVGPN